MKKSLLVLSVVVAALLPTLQSLAQITPQPGQHVVDNVPAQAAATGHESAKAEINFTELANYFAAHPQPLVRKELENERDNNRPAVEKPYEPWLIHTRALSSDRSSELPHSAYLPISSAPVDTFKAGGDDGTSIPPDTHGAVNGAYCMTSINDSVTIRNRTGTEVQGMTLDQFWTAVLPGGDSFDPRIFYDRYTDRWYMIADANGDAASSALLVAISKTNNPPGAWYEFIVPVGIAGYWVDYPTVGYNSKWIAVGGNPFSVGSGASNGATVYIFNKALLLAGTSATFTRIDQTSSFTICPAQMYDNSVDASLWAVESWDNTTGKLQLWKISGPVGAPTMAVVGQPSSAPFTWNYQASVGGGGGDFAPQAGTANLIQCNDDRIYDLKYINGNLWCSHNVFLPATGTTTHCSVQWWQFDTLANPIQIGYVNDNAATNPNFYYFPAVAVNMYNDVLVGFTTSSKLTRVNAAYALHLHTDPVDSTRPAYVFRHGQSTYFKNYGGPRDRWGDYSQSCLDTNLTNFWTIQETVAATNIYDTWWAYVCMKPISTITPAGALAVCSPGTVTLNANTGYDLTYQWELGGAAIGGATNSSYTATVSGTYNVVVYNAGQCDSVSLPVVVTINPLPAAISGTLTVCTGGTTSLSDATAGGTWSTTAGSGSVTLGTPGAVVVVTGVSLGTATISYTSSAGCFVTAIVTVNAGAAATITPAGSTTFCSPGSVVLNANTGAGLTYQWQVGGVNISGATLSSYTATTSGNYTVIVYQPGGCSATSAIVVVTVGTPPGATITPAGSTTFCTGGSVVLNANTGAGYTYQWQLGGVNIGGATNSSYTATLGGNYTVIVSSSGCNSTSSVTTVTVNAGPGATITPAGSTTFCAPGSVVLNANTGAGITYQWQLGGVNIGGATNSSYTATLGGNYTVIVSQGACVVTSGITIVTVNNLPTVPAVGGATTNVCNGQTITLTDATAGGVWSSTNMAVATISTGGVVTGASLGTTTISYTITNLCGSVAATTIVTVNIPTVVAAITGSTIICAGGTTTLSDVTASGVWGSSNLGVATVSAGGVVTGVAAGTALISYSVTNASGCVSSATTTVTVSTPFTATITPLGSTTFCTGGFVVFNATTGVGYTYQWQLGGVPIAGATLSSYTASLGGNYTVIISDPGGCTSTSAIVTVTINAGLIVVPSVSVAGNLGTILCTSASSETFTATPVNGGATPTYQWYVNGIATGVGVTYSYTPANGDIVKCVMTSNAPCAFPDTASNSVMITVSPLQTPAVSITSIHNDSTCIGDTVQFAAVPVFGGTAPTYLWTENGINVATGPYYIYAPHDGDTLIVTMTSNYPCLSTPTAVSSMFIIHAFAPSTNSLSVTVSQSTILAGRVDTFTATATGAGTSPSFQWYINGNPVAGATSYRYITDSLQAGQIVNCKETSSFICASPQSIFSGGILVDVLPNSVQQVGNNPSHFTLLPNPNRGEFTIGGTIGTAGDDKVTIVMTDVLGQTIFNKATFANNGIVNEHINLGSSLANGNYMVTITSGEDHVVFHVTVDK